MLGSQSAITVCTKCVPVTKNGVQDTYYRHYACHDTCERYNKQKKEAEVRKKKTTDDDVYVLNKLRKYKGKI